MTTIEKRGAKNLAKPDPKDRGRVCLRVYYYGEGDDLLCFDAGPMGRSATDTLCRDLGLVEDGMMRRPRGGQMSIGEPRSGVVAAEIVPGHDREKRRPMLGARLAVLPHATPNDEATP